MLLWRLGGETVLYEQKKMNWKLSLNDKIDHKLLENFPIDPYSDITIQTASSQLCLTLAYLSIDSGYFSQIDPNTTCIYLKHLPQTPLVSVLRALYGGPLDVSSVNDLQQVLKVIEYLDIGQFKQNIQKQMIKVHRASPQKSPLHSIDLLQFCLKHSLIKQFICQIHFSHKLKSLQSSKNYLQLSKLSPENLNYLLINYLAKEGSLGSKTINSILENYFNRKSIRPIQYLENQELQPLKLVWEQYHHKITLNKALKPLSKTFPNADIRVSIFLNEVTSPENDKIKRLSTSPGYNMQSIKMGQQIFKQDQISQQSLLDWKLKILCKEKEDKDRKISELQQQMKILEMRLQIRKKQEKGQLQDITLLQNIARSRKSQKDNFNIEQSITKNQNAFVYRRTSIQKIKSTGKATVQMYSNKVIN